MKETGHLFTSLKKQVDYEFQNIFEGKGLSAESLEVKKKDDKSFVTYLDLKISDIVDQELREFFSGRWSFYSEENQGDYQFPCAILDPIDGTRELVAGLPECVVSLALMDSNVLSECQKHEAWIYNPFTGFELSSRSSFTQAPAVRERNYLGLVSQSEFSKGLYGNGIFGDFIVRPKGSIAYKLALLAAGACDFVITLTNKNIWDIAAGTILCQQRGINAYDLRGRLESFPDTLLKGPLIWCPDHLYLDLKDIIIKERERSGF